jgi:4-hydroxy-2-oxoheptanedioate aldolase
MSASARPPRGFSAESDGVWCSDSSPGAVARLARSGFDWLCLDQQHGIYDRASTLEVARSFPDDAAELIVRVPAGDFAFINAALDAGAKAVIVPQIESAGQAAQAVAATFYPPRGGRSWGQLEQTWGRPMVEAQAANARTRCAVMIESETGLDHVEAIAAVPGLDLLFIGPYDLSLSLGTTVPELLGDHSPGSPLRRIIAAAHSRGLMVGGFGGNPDDAELFRSHGISCVVVATDLWVTEAGARAALAAVDQPG